ncbi:hypothetical protein Tco_0854110, partial [Tanacetum coccineum]
LGWHLKEIHVTWAHLEKKRTRIQLYIQVDEELCIHTVETALGSMATQFGLHGDDVKIYCEGVRVVAVLKNP